MFFHLVGTPFSKTMCISYVSSIQIFFFPMGKMREVKSSDILCHLKFENTPFVCLIFSNYKWDIAH